MRNIKQFEVDETAKAKSEKKTILPEIPLGRRNTLYFRDRIFVLLC